MELQVQKKDGSIEAFDIAKIRNAVINAGATNEEVDHLVPDVAAWAEATAESGVITSGAIHDEVVRLLRDVNPVAATVFEGFKKTTVA